MLEISDNFPRTGFLQKKYPRVFQAESIEDIQLGRAEEAKGLRGRAGLIPHTNFGDQPSKLVSEDITAVIFLPEVQHYPAMDPSKDIKRLYGTTIHDNWAMKLSDRTGSINVWFDQESHLDFPYVTCFDDRFFGIFDMEKWKEWRGVSWKKAVILLAQYSELYGSILKSFWHEAIKPEQYRPVTEYYWLIHVFDYEGAERRRVREEVRIPNLIPVPIPNPV